MLRGGRAVCPRLTRLLAVNSATTARLAAARRVAPALLVLICAGVAVGTAIQPAVGAVLGAVACAAAITAAMALGVRLPAIVWPALALPGVAVTALWPTAGVTIAVVLAITVLAVREPPYAFVAALLMFGFEGSIKMRLTLEGAPHPLAIGAALIDLALVISVLGLLFEDRGHSLRDVWGRFGRMERLVVWSLVAWVVLAVLQVPLANSLSEGAGGLRLVHFYLIAIPGGMLLAARLPAERVAVLLMGMAVVIAAYAAFRGLVGNTEHEKEFTRSRAEGTFLGKHQRDSGSFTSPIALASFAVPATVFGFTLAFMEVRQRVLGGVLFVLGLVGAIASYVRTALIAIAAGALALAAVLAAGHGVPRRLKLIAAGLAVTVLVGGYGATLLAGDVDPFAKHRAESLSNPFGDYSLKERYKTWERTLKKVVHNPEGTGTGTVGRATIKGSGRKAVFTDNSYLKILQEQGFLGGLLFLFGVLGAVVLCWRRLVQIGPLSRPLGVAALVAFVSFLVLCLTGEYVEQPGKAFVWAMLGITAWEAYGR
jgi:O-Antigen ligase